MVVVGVCIIYVRESIIGWLVVVFVSLVVVMFYQLYWDFVKDWGFLNFKFKNVWLRDDLVFKNKNIYYFFIVS